MTQTGRDGVYFDQQGQHVGTQINVAGDYYTILPPTNPRERRNRAAMLQLVRNTWIKGVLEQSLHGAALLELGMEYNPAAVDHPWDMVVQIPDRPNKALPPKTRIVEVFDELGGSLLILGEPGSGKTTMLLELARDLIARAEQDETLPLPVVFNLSSWAVKQSPLEEWLLEELRTKYYIPKKLARTWIEEDILLLLLDGLDEVRGDARDKCVAAINAFRQARLIPLVVCSRTADYKAMTARLQLQGAISLRPLTPAQIDAYLAGAGTELQAVRATLQHDPILQEMAQSPLMLSIMTLAYHGKTITDLQTLATPEARRQHLFDVYIERMFQRRGKDSPYDREQTRRWLAWLAERLTAHNQTVFYIEKLQPTWLPAPERQQNHWLVGLVLGLVTGLVAGLVAGLVEGLGVGLFVLLYFGLFVKFGEVKPVETLTWSWQEAREVLGTWLFAGLAYGLVVGLVYGLFAGLVGGLVVGLLFGLFVGLVSGEMDSKTIPNQGIRRSLKNALFVVLSFVLIEGLFLGLVVGLSGGLVIGLITGLVYGLIKGGGAVILHYSLRTVLVRTDRAPWNYIRFLDHCTDRIFLRRVGGGYIFIHRLLMEHFASLEQADAQ